MRAILAWLVALLVAAGIFGVGLLAGYIGEKITSHLSHPCECGCDQTGECKCPNCNVGCGFSESKPE